MAIYKGNKKVIALYKGNTPIIKRYKGTQLVFDATNSGCGDEPTSSSIFDTNKLDIEVEKIDTSYSAISFRTSQNQEVKTFDLTGATRIQYEFSDEELNQIRSINIVNSKVIKIHKMPNITWSATASWLKDLDMEVIDLSGMKYINTPYSGWSNLVYGSEMSSSIKVLKLNDISIDGVLEGTMGTAFYSFSNLEELYLRNLPINGDTSFFFMFSSSPNLKIIDVTGLDISKATSTTAMFDNSPSLQKLILGNVSQSTYDWWYAKLSSEGIQEQVTIDCTIV